MEALVVVDIILVTEEEEVKAAVQMVQMVKVKVVVGLVEEINQQVMTETEMGVVAGEIVQVLGLLLAEVVVEGAVALLMVVMEVVAG
jgi:hypothetical protein